jgi:hypothetical protein
MLEIQFLAWDRHKNVGGINQYYAFTIFHLFFFANHDVI